MSWSRVGRGREIVLGVIGVWVSAVSGCASRASDLDIQEVCATRANCGSTDIACQQNLRAQRNNADEVGCAGELAAAIACEKGDGTCMARSACREEYERADACLASPPDAADPAAFCEQYRTQFCRREFEGGRLAESDREICLQRTGEGGPYTSCTGFNFTTGCIPSRDRADRCISTLESTPVSVRTADVSECDFCE